MFKDKIFLKSERQTPNVKRLLTKAKFTSKQPEEFKAEKMQWTYVRSLYEHLMDGSPVSFKDKTFKVNDTMTCKAKNGIYVIQCRGCNEQYS